MLSGDEKRAIIRQLLGGGDEWFASFVLFCATRQVCRELARMGLDEPYQPFIDAEEVLLQVLPEHRAHVARFARKLADKGLDIDADELWRLALDRGILARESRRTALALRLRRLNHPN